MPEKNSKPFDGVETAIAGLVAAGRRDALAEDTTAAVQKHLEAIAERCVLAQIEPLEKLIREAQELIALQMQHLARLKLELAALLASGEQAAALAQTVHDSVAQMREQHQSLLEAKTRN